MFVYLICYLRFGNLHRKLQLICVIYIYIYIYIDRQTVRQTDRETRARARTHTHTHTHIHTYVHMHQLICRQVKGYTNRVTDMMPTCLGHKIAQVLYVEFAISSFIASVINISILQHVDVSVWLSEQCLLGSVPSASLPSEAVQHG